jgi:hypothetical protein
MPDQQPKRNSLAAAPPPKYFDLRKYDCSMETLPWLLPVCTHPMNLYPVQQQAHITKLLLRMMTYHERILLAEHGLCNYHNQRLNAGNTGTAAEISAVQPGCTTGCCIATLNVVQTRMEEPERFCHDANIPTLLDWTF